MAPRKAEGTGSGIVGGPCRGKLQVNCRIARKWSTESCCRSPDSLAEIFLLPVLWLHKMNCYWNSIAVNAEGKERVFSCGSLMFNGSPTFPSSLEHNLWLRKKCLITDQYLGCMCRRSIQPFVLRSDLEFQFCYYDNAWLSAPGCQCFHQHNGEKKNLMLCCNDWICYHLGSHCFVW